ncbi:MAG TPA: sulfurtransferase-like selenium metabolism protein YedF [bacterium]|nr:sulfurtransferase-like selenium metabolism protein YedF [bacterium]
MKKMDLKGLACPEPIVRVKKAMVDEGEAAVSVTIDSRVTRDNLAKFAATKGFHFQETEKDGEWEIVIEADPNAAPVTEPTDAPALKQPPVVLCTRPTFGAATGDLGTILIRAFFKTLLNVDAKPAKILFVNEGVTLPCFDAQVIEYCRELEALGCEIISCGTCLDYLGHMNDLKVGRVGNMYDIASAMMDAGHLVEP